MAKEKAGSIVRQCTNLVNGEIHQLGESKYEARQEAMAEIREQGGSVNSHEINQRIGIFSSSSARQALGYWCEAGNYIKEEFGVKNIFDIKPEHVASYLEHKLEQGVTAGTYENVCSHMEKLGVALSWESKDESGRYNFSPTIENVREEANAVLVDNPAVNRKYDNPTGVIGAMQNPTHQVGGSLMYEGGARISEVSVLKESNLKGHDSNGNGVIHLTNTKNGMERDMTVSGETYNKVVATIEEKGVFKFDQGEFRADLRQACYAAGENADNGAHGFRYNFAQEKYEENLEKGMTVKEAKYDASEKLGHGRSEITDRYLGR